MDIKIIKIKQAQNQNITSVTTSNVADTTTSVKVSGITSENELISVPELIDESTFINTTKSNDETTSIKASVGKDATTSIKTNEKKDETTSIKASVAKDETTSIKTSEKKEEVTSIKTTTQKEEVTSIKTNQNQEETTHIKTGSASNCTHIKTKPKEEEVKTNQKSANEAARIENAKLIATRVYDAVDGAGTDEEALKDALIGLSKEDAALVKEAYMSLYGENIEDAIKDDTSGELKKILLSALEGKTATKKDEDFDAKKVADQVHDAVDGWGTDEDSLKSALLGLTAEQANEVKDVYKSTYGGSLEDAIKGDTSGQLKKILLSAIEGKTATKETQSTEKSKMQQKAVQIHSAIDGAGTDEDALKSLLLGISADEANQVKAEYEALYGESLEDAIKGDTSGQLKKILLSAVEGKTETKKDEDFDAEEVAEKAYKAMKGAGTNEEALKDAIIGLSSKQAAEVAEVFEEKYGKSLRKRIEKETSGQLQKILLSYIPE